LVAAQAIKILVVDDEPMIHNFLRIGLRYEGFSPRPGAARRAGPGGPLPA
jgi:hypothetical protein